MSEQTILFVDDEKSILKTLRRLFVDEGYSILLAGSGKEALDMINGGEQPMVIVSDQRMPGMSGSEFLEQAREKLPDSIRIVLTGYADINAAVDAVNKGGIYRYILKPWNDEDLKLTVRDAFSRYGLLQQNRRLTAELQEKNKILTELNATLEQKVLERTRKLEDAYQKNLALTRILSQKVKELEGRDRIQQLLLTIHPLDETLQTVLDVIIEVVRAAASVIYLQDSPAKPLTIAGSRHTPNVEGDVLSAILEGRQDYNPAILIQTAFAEGKPVRHELRDVRTGSNTASVCLAFVPVMKGDQALGVIGVGRPGAAMVSDNEVKTLSGFGMQAAIAISDSQMNDSLPDMEASLDAVLKDLT